MSESRAALLDRLRASLTPSGETARPDDRRPTGWSALDEATGGGLFRGALNEVLPDHRGSGALEALLGAFVRPCTDHKLFAWVHPSRLPYPPALARAGHRLDRWIVVRPTGSDDHLWAVDQLLRSGVCEGLVTTLDLVPDRALRRLQLAAREGGTTALVFRPRAAGARPSPAALRLAASPHPAPTPRRRGLLVEVLKCQGTAFPRPVLLEWNHDALDEPAFSRPAPRTLDEIARPQGRSVRPFSA